MNDTAKYPIIIACIFVWIGFVCAISFMEAWLKFRAPGITLSLGLSIGRVVFNALNKVELFLSIIVVVNILMFGGHIFKWKYLYFFIPFSILIIQTIWLLPSLDARAQVYINGGEASSSNSHIIYVVLEFVKVLFLCIFGVKLLKS